MTTTRTALAAIAATVLLAACGGSTPSGSLAADATIPPTATAATTPTTVEAPTTTVEVTTTKAEPTTTTLDVGVVDVNDGTLSLAEFDQIESRLRHGDVLDFDSLAVVTEQTCIDLGASIEEFRDAFVLDEAMAWQMAVNQPDFTFEVAIEAVRVGLGAGCIDAFNLLEEKPEP